MRGCAVVFAFLTVFLLSCAPASESPQDQSQSSAPSESSGPVGAASQSGASVASGQSEPSLTRAAQSVRGDLSAVPGSVGDCKVSGLNVVKNDYDDSPGDAYMKYVGELICLRGKITGHIDDGVALSVGDVLHVPLRKRPEYSLSTPRMGYEREHSEWVKWLAGSSVGDHVDIQCRIKDLPSKRLEHQAGPPLGTPLVKDCAPLSAAGGMAFMPTSLPAPTPTRTPKPPPEPTPTSPSPQMLSLIGCKDCPILKLEHGFDASTLEEGKHYRATACTEFAGLASEKVYKEEKPFFWAHRSAVWNLIIDGRYSTKHYSGRDPGECRAMKLLYLGEQGYYQSVLDRNHVALRRTKNSQEWRALPTFRLLDYVLISEAHHEHGFFPETEQE